MHTKLQLAAIADANNIPQSPGVYFFQCWGKILYIGKAANLRSRLRSYFQTNLASPKTSALLKESTQLSWEILGSETEALIREAELIKKYRPKYNVLMRDDKQYFFVGFTKETFPKIFVTHQKKSGVEYVGPFTEGGALRAVLKLLRRAFPYCMCKQQHKRLCLNAKIGRCFGFCCTSESAKQALRENLAQRGGASRAIRQQANMRACEKRLAEPIATYKKNIGSIKKILYGKNKSLARELKKEMIKLSNETLYEEAGKIRDKIKALEKIFAHSAVIKKDSYAESAKALVALSSLLEIPEIKRVEAYDIANLHGKFAYGSMAVWETDGLRKNEYRIFKIKTLDTSNDPAMIKEVLSRRLKHTEWQYPQVIIVDGGKAQFSVALAAIPTLTPPYKGGVMEGIPKIIALTKNEKHIGDHLFIENKKERISLNQLPEALKNFILHLDSEAHRFAISHYRKSHRRNLTSQ